jgi:hypothetical protein
MHRKVIKSWEDLWAVGAKMGGTHWNYSRGKIRFRPIQKQPSLLGSEAYVRSEVPIRVRFYVLTDERFVERFRSEVRFQPPPVEERVFPPGFEDWSRLRKRRHITTWIQKLSRRSPRQKASSDPDLIFALEYIREQTLKKPPHQADTPRPRPPVAAGPKMPLGSSEPQQKPSYNAKAQPPQQPSPTGPQPSTQPPARINNVWEFLSHPKAAEMLPSLFRTLTQDKDRAQTFAEAILQLPLLKAAGLLPFK